MRNILTLLTLVAVALASGCATTDRATGGVTEDEPVKIVWHKVDDPHKICEARSGQVSFFKIKGCSSWTDEKVVIVGVEEKGHNRVCHIWSKKPESNKDLDRFVTLGHEVMHCFEGNWHDKYGRYNEDWKRPKLVVEVK